MVNKFHLLKLDVIWKNRLTFISSSKVKNTFLWNITTGSSEIKNITNSCLMLIKSHREIITAGELYAIVI